MTDPIKKVQAASLGCLLSGTAAGFMGMEGGATMAVLGTTLLIFSGTMGLSGAKQQADIQAGTEGQAAQAEKPAAQKTRGLASLFNKLRGGARAVRDHILAPAFSLVRHHPGALLGGALGTALLIAGVQHEDAPKSGQDTKPSAPALSVPR